MDAIMDVAIRLVALGQEFQRIAAARMRDSAPGSDWWIAATEIQRDAYANLERAYRIKCSLEDMGTGH